MAITKLFRIGALGCAAGLASAALGWAAPAPKSEQVLGSDTLSFTEAQATAGGKIFQNVCTTCHGDQLQGGSGPPLKGLAFISKWSRGDKTIEDLRSYLHFAMPMNAPGSLSKEDSYSVVAFILSRNGYAPGADPLSPKTAWQYLPPPPEAGVQIRHIDMPLPAPPNSVTQASTAKPDDSELADPNDSEWLVYNHDLRGQRYSKLDRITAKNAHDLTAQCIFQLGEIGAFQTSPVVYDGAIYVTSAFKTYAIDATNCASVV